MTNPRPNLRQRKWLFSPGFLGRSGLRPSHVRGIPPATPPFTHLPRRTCVQCICCFPLPITQPPTDGCHCMYWPCACPVPPDRWTANSLIHSLHEFLTCPYLPQTWTAPCGARREERGVRSEEGGRSGACRRRRAPPRMTET